MNSQNQITLKKVTLSGFRAYLNEQEFTVSNQTSHFSLATYAPNGKGKSSFVDALEFFFSPSGIVNRLGDRKSMLRAGKEAVNHYQAKEKNIPSVVKVDFSKNNQTIPETRKTDDSTVPSTVVTLNSAAKVQFIIRGHELRRFVEEQTPQDRYEELAKWFGFSPLLSTQDALRELKLNLNKKVNDSSSKQVYDKRTQQITKSKQNSWNEAEATKWFNENILTHLSPTLKITSLNELDPAYIQIKNNKIEESKSTGLSVFETIEKAIKALYTLNLETSEETGLIANTIVAKNKFDADTEELEKVKSESAKSIFSDVWTAANNLFSSEKFIDDTCPVCNTSFDKTASGSKNDVHLHIKTGLENLKTLKNAQDKLKLSKKQFDEATTKLSEGITSLVTALQSSGFKDEITAFISIKTDLVKIIEDKQKLKSFKASLLSLETKNKSKITELTTVKKEYTYSSALPILEDLIKLKNEYDTYTKEMSELTKIQTRVSAQITIIDQYIKTYVTNLIASLQDKINLFYSEIQKGAKSTPKIYLKLPDNAAVQQQISLVIDFAENRKEVLPSGYLSDSQIHTLALSIRLASICMFNKDFPFIVLDDVITSYDTDHRLTLVSLIAKHLNQHQLFVFTHDEQFFNFLQENLPENRWRFKRIMFIEENFGPKFTDHKVKDAEIEEVLNQGKTAANLIRQAEEEWLLSMCRGFGVDVRIREINKPYIYDRSELAKSLHRFLNESGIGYPNTENHTNPFLNTLQKGTLENFGSHFSDNPNASASIGDEKTRWTNFQEFKSYFNCKNPSCKKGRFKRPENFKKPSCQYCETPFSIT